MPLKTALTNFITDQLRGRHIAERRKFQHSMSS